MLRSPASYCNSDRRLSWHILILHLATHSKSKSKTRTRCCWRYKTPSPIDVMTLESLSIQEHRLTQQSTHWARGNIECIRQQINLLFAQEWMWSGGDSIPTFQITCEGSNLYEQNQLHSHFFYQGKRCWWQLIPATWLHLRIRSREDHWAKIVEQCAI